MLLQRKIEVLYFIMGSYIRGKERVSIDWLIGCWLTDLWIDHLGAVLISQFWIGSGINAKLSTEWTDWAVINPDFKKISMTVMLSHCSD